MAPIEPIKGHKAIEKRSRRGEYFHATRKSGDVYYARFVLTSKTSVYLFNTRVHLYFRSCGFDACRKNVWTLWWLGLSRQRTDSVLVGSRTIFSLWCLFHWVRLVSHCIRSVDFPSEVKAKAELLWEKGSGGCGVARFFGILRAAQDDSRDKQQQKQMQQQQQMQMRGSFATLRMTTS